MPREGDGEVAGDEVDAHELHDRANSSLRHAVELVDVWQAGGLVDVLVGQKLLELLGQELGGVFAVNGAEYRGGRVGVGGDGRAAELRDEPLGLVQGVGLALEQVLRLLPGVVINDNKDVLVPVYVRRLVTEMMKRPLSVAVSHRLITPCLHSAIARAPCIPPLFVMCPVHRIASSHLALVSTTELVTFVNTRSWHDEHAGPLSRSDMVTLLSARPLQPGRGGEHGAQ